MKSILELIKKSANDERAFVALERIYGLNDQLMYARNITESADYIFTWLSIHFNVDNLTFSLFDIDDNTKSIIYKKGEEFYLDDELTMFFIINTHTNLNAIVSFNTNSKVHFEILQRNYSVIEAAFSQIAPIIQSGILKKNYVESQSIDSVTNVYNRQYLTKHVKKLLSLSKNKTSSIYFLMIGIDHFKAVIDEFDYDVGDKVLIELAKVIHGNISEFDVVARLTGDEFLVSLINTSSKNEVEKTAQKIIEEFSKIEITVHGKYILKKTICIGLTLYHTYESIDDAIKNADMALYEAKNTGRSTLQHFTEIKEEDTIDLF